MSIEVKVGKQLESQYKELEDERTLLVWDYSDLMNLLNSPTLAVDDTAKIYQSYNRLSENILDASDRLAGPLENRVTENAAKEKSKLVTLQGWTPAILIVVVECILGFFGYEFFSLKDYDNLKIITALMFVPLAMFFAPAIKYLFSELKETIEAERETYTSMIGECLKETLDLKKCAEVLASVKLRLEQEDFDKVKINKLQMREDILKWAQEDIRLSLITRTQAIFLKAKSENLLMVKDLNEITKSVFTQQSGGVPKQ
ncbi:MAG: hypothetical protein KGN01_06470 [Patescibacteria group bacterium]|nr:hypothetical protein [Patescibacteria group bacterium]